MPSSLPLTECFRTIAESRGDIAWIVDCGTRALAYISPSASDMLGYAPAQFDDQLATGRDGPLALLCGGLDERLRRFAAGDISRLNLVREFDLEHGAQARTVPVHVTSTLLLDGAGAAYALAGSIRDLSELREAAAGQRRFASMLNHEFRTPLSTIDGAIQRLEVTGKDADDATRQRYRKIAGAVDRMIAMLDEYLSPDRLASTGHKRKEHTAEPQRLLDEAAGIARAAGRAVTVDAGGLPGQIRCAPDGLRLALKVLLENAIQYSPESAVIELSGVREDGGIALLVRDKGEGVPDADVARVFDKFYRGSNAGNRPGSGLGLYMARSVVEVHGGNLTVDHHDECGAVFRLWLPHQDFDGKKVAPEVGSSDNPPD
ncbi:ATP-binding protein [Massilia sp. GCM10020059]|uniref:histidine kinase n=1 Tax=Massilia agrisoli TaxID=2892444 RepID=A0ABS8IRD4_9BURK|nr:HAMP domain-containing sensor histidine kinase [Massilia agrisoli]MCC6070471.1 HAMP domain-containing histidine kinase [Massilia agrisoli]